MLVQLAAHIFVLVALKLFLNSLLYNFLIIILKFSIKKKKKNFKLKRPSKNNTITVYQSLKTSADRECIILQDTAL